MSSHHFILLSLKRFPWAVCDKCGIIALKNQLTAKKMNRQCPGAEGDDKAKQKEI